MSHGLDQYQKEFIKLVRQNSGARRASEVFRDFCEMAAIALSNRFDVARFHDRERRYGAIEARYDREQVGRFHRMLACITNSLNSGHKDCLGQIFMEMDLGNAFGGQFFTPYEISTLMAHLTLGPITQEDVDAKGGFIRIHDPAVGAGAMVIAMSEALANQGINYQRCMHVVAQDIDSTACHLAFIQFSVLAIPAVVIVGNTLTMEVREQWLTPAHIVGHWGARIRRREAMEKEQLEPSSAGRVGVVATSNPEGLPANDTASLARIGG